MQPWSPFSKKLPLDFKDNPWELLEWIQLYLLIIFHFIKGCTIVTCIEEWELALLMMPLTATWESLCRPLKWWHHHILHKDVFNECLAHSVLGFRFTSYPTLSFKGVPIFEHEISVIYTPKCVFMWIFNFFYIITWAPSKARFFYCLSYLDRPGRGS